MDMLAQKSLATPGESQAWSLSDEDGEKDGGAEGDDDDDDDSTSDDKDVKGHAKDAKGSTSSRGTARTVAQQLQCCMCSCTPDKDVGMSTETLRLISSCN